MFCGRLQHDTVSFKHDNPQPPATARCNIKRTTGISKRRVLSAREITTNQANKDFSLQIANDKDAGRFQYDLSRGILREFKTGNDVAKFFAIHGTQTPIKYVKLNRDKSTKRYRPFDLVVVPATKLDPEYFTITG